MNRLYFKLYFEFTENVNTKKYLIDNDGLRTIADEDGQALMKGLEFSSLVKVSVKGELENFIYMLKQLEKEPDVAKVEIILGELPCYRVFSTLSDGETKRKYAICKITMFDGTERSVSYIEREERALSMLILKEQSSVNCKYIYSKLLYGMVNESGGPMSIAWTQKLYNIKITFLVLQILQLSYSLMRCEIFFYYTKVLYIQRELL